MLEMLLKAGADADAVVASTGLRPIHLACGACAPEPLQVLLRYGADPNRRDAHRGNAFDRFFGSLPTVSSTRVVPVLRLLLSAGCTKGHRHPLEPGWVYSPLYSLTMNHITMLDYLLANTWHVPEQRDAQGYVVHSMTVFYRANLLYCLLRHGLDPNARDAQGETILGSLTKLPQHTGRFHDLSDAFRALICAGLDLALPATPSGPTHAQFLARECPLGIDLKLDAAAIRRHCAERLTGSRKHLLLQKIP